MDVARAARVSQATVSRAFNPPHRVTPDKRERVYDSASKLGYVPNAIRRSLSFQSILRRIDGALLLIGMLYAIC